MKKSILFCMSALLMLSVSMISCSNDDESIDEMTDVSRGDDVDALDKKQEDIMGEWQLVNCRGGYASINEDVEPGEITLTFNKDGVVMINNIDEKKYHFPYSTGSYEYTFKEMTPYKSKESRTVLVIDSNFLISDYDFYYDDDMLILSPYEVVDFYDYRLKKVE